MKSLFPERERSRLEALGQIAFCNPFSKERERLELQVLGRSVVEPVLREEKDERYSPWLDEILAISEKALVEASKKRRLDQRYAERDEDLYRNLFFVWTYHEWIPVLDEIIASGAENTTRKELNAYRRFLERYEEWAPLFWRDTPECQPARLFASYFQIRRAFYHIFRFIIGRSAPVNQLRRCVWESIFTVDMLRYQRVLTNRMHNMHTLVTGPSGSGKELVSRAIGQSCFLPFDPQKGFDRQSKERFLPVNLSALTENLLESELFGHHRGAFTGAVEDRAGYFEEAGPHGCVFLDEIGDAGLPVQVKLLRVLESRGFQRLGETRARRFEGKVIAATNRNLSADIANGQFREDLYYRLCGDRVSTPSLREILDDHPDDMERMVAYIAVKLVGEEESERFTEQALAFIQRRIGADYPWPGNFRELERCVSNYLIHGNDPRENIVSVVSKVTVGDWRSSLKQFPEMPLAQLIEAYTQQVWQKNGSYLETARLLEVDQRTVRKYTLRALRQEGHAQDDVKS
jgi:DNA-binding NtrC family response regulator